MNINIQTIIGRSAQGVTRPFFCEADDGFRYYVKGNCAGNAALIHEWIAGNIAQRMGLPIPEFRQANVAKDLVTLSAREDIGDLGAGVGFASRLVENAAELSYLYITQIDVSLRARILLFDWWTLNGDRTLTEAGGNPNILWVHRDHRPFVIDHNLAFDPDGNKEFWKYHIFAADRVAWTPAFRKEMEPLMGEIVNEAAQWWTQMPGAWTDVDSGTSLESVKGLLSRFQTANFWEVQ